MIEPGNDKPVTGGEPEISGTTAAQPDGGLVRGASAWRSVQAWVVLGIVTIAGLVSDLVSKTVAFERIADRPVVFTRAEVLRYGPGRLGDLIPAHAPVVVVNDLLELTLVLNPGAVFGIGAGKRWFFVVFTALAIGFAVWLFGSWTRPRDWWAHSALGMILAGGLGNLYDRLVFGCVRDFLHPLPGVLWPGGWSSPWGGREVWPYVSNVADLLLIIGVGMMVIHSIRGGKQNRAA